MGIFLDMRSSMNASKSGEGPGIDLGPEPELFGRIGLKTAYIKNPTIIFSGTIGLLGETGDTFAVEIVRGTVYNPANVIYRAEGVIGVSGSNEIESFNAQDLTAPSAAESIYASYISGVSTTVRNGPEVFSGIASVNIPFFLYPIYWVLSFIRHIIMHLGGAGNGNSSANKKSNKRSKK